MVDRLTIFCVPCQTLSSIMLITRITPLLFIIFSYSALAEHGDLRAQSKESNTRWIIQDVAIRIDSLLKKYDENRFYLEMNVPEPVLTQLKSELLQRKYILLDQQGDGIIGKKLKIEPNLFLSYKKMSKKEGQRLLKANISIQLINENGVIQLSEWIEYNNSQIIGTDFQSYEDNIWEMSRFKEIKAGKRSDHFKKVMEPTLIISTIAVTIFLLFNVRSQ